MLYTRDSLILAFMWTFPSLPQAVRILIVSVCVFSVSWQPANVAIILFYSRLRNPSGATELFIDRLIDDIDINIGIFLTPARDASSMTPGFAWGKHLF